MGNSLIQAAQGGAMPMRFNRQTGQKLTLSVISISFITLWAVIVGGAHPLKPMSRTANPDEGTSAKKKREPRADKTVPTKIGSNDAPPEGKASDSEADLRNGDRDVSSSSPNRTVAAETDTASRLGALEEAIRLQNEKLSQMQRIIEQQERTIEMLAGKPTANPMEAGSERAAGAPTTKASTETATLSSIQKPEQPNAQQTLEDRLQKIEDTVRKVGPIRWSGDFRLRFDAFFRPASKLPDPPSLHQQNVRMRYRFRLNLDADATPYLSFHGQLSTGPVNNQLTSDQDFTGIVVKHPFFINEAWMDFHPNKNIQLQAGRLLPLFADGSLFTFDDDIRFNGFSEKFNMPLKSAPAGITNLEFRAGQYIFSNPVVAIVDKGSPLNLAGAKVGSTGRAANLFHQGFVVDQELNEQWSQQFTTDVQLYRNPNQIQLGSTQTGVLFVGSGIGIALSGPLIGVGNATTTPGGAIYRAGNFQIGRVAYRINNTGFSWGDHRYPISLYVQLMRNFGTGAHEKDAMMTTLQLGKLTKRGDSVFTYFFTIKGANSMISQFTDDDPGSGSGVNIRVHMLRWDIALAKNVSIQTMGFVRHGLRSSGQFPNFFVPLDGFIPTLYRFQERLLFSF
jgi:hypothetical protein